MSSKRCFKAKKTVRVLSYKRGKVARQSNLSVPLRYSFEPSSSGTVRATGLSSGSTEEHSADSGNNDSLDRISAPFASKSPSFVTKRKRGKLRIKEKLRAYHDRKARLGTAWLNIRQSLLSALLQRQTLQDKNCVIASCEENACGRCLDCGPSYFLCSEHMNLIHAAGKTLHSPEIWKDNRYVLYEFQGPVIWDTKHNADHGYTRDIVVINQNGQQSIIKVKFCCHEPEAVTLLLNGLWPSSPKEPQAAFDTKFMERIKYLFLECRVSLKSICQAMHWLAPSFSRLYVNNVELLQCPGLSLLEVKLIT